MTQPSSASIPGRVDVAVIGGGPGGGTVSALLAMKGHRVALFEKETYPRFHIGESLMPHTYWTLEKLGMLDRLRRSGSPLKASVQFFNEHGQGSRPYYFFERNPHECSYTWQVERSWMDHQFLENAAEKGVQVKMATPVKEVLFEGERAVGVEVVDAGGALRRVEAKVVVDASGQNSFIARRLGLRRKDPKLIKGAVFAHYHNARRDPGIDEGATLVINTRSRRGWFWYIPLWDNRVSIGVVGDPRELFEDSKSPDQILDEQVASCPAVAERVREATRLPPTRVLSDFSYRSTRIAGDGWVLVGDAFAFLDPIYSSGFLLALKSGEMAAEAIDAALQSGDLSAAALGSFASAYVRGLESIRKLVYAFYTRDFSFGAFLRKHPEHRGRVVDILIGDVFKDGVEEIFDDMGKFCPLPSSIPLEPSPAATAST
jgi:flavin-dependent dehydrogenase